LYGLVTQAAVGRAFTATVAGSPPVGCQWSIQHLTVEVPNYVSGAVTAQLFIAGRYVAGTNQGQNDSLSGPVRRVNAGELLTVTWKPTNVAGIIQGRVTVDVMQGAPLALTRAGLS
jgi:hypothetical protein